MKEAIVFSYHLKDGVFRLVRCSVGKDACHRAGHPELESSDPRGVRENQLLKDVLCPPRCAVTHTLNIIRIKDKRWHINYKSFISFQRNGASFLCYF